MTVHSPKPYTDVGQLSWIVGHGDDTTSHKWVMEQAHFHWGRAGKVDEGSEHHLHGQAYPLEIHFVHYNPAYGDSVAEAAGSGETDALMVVGVLFELGSSEPASLTTIANGVSQARPEATHLHGTVLLNDIFDGTGSYYSYRGGLTTPSCNEIVTWVVMESPKKITSASLSKFKDASAYPASFAASEFSQPVKEEKVSKFGNFRPLQPKGSRSVYSSAGVTSTCAPVRDVEPCATGVWLLICKAECHLKFLLNVFVCASLLPSLGGGTPMAAPPSFCLFSMRTMSS